MKVLFTPSKPHSVVLGFCKVKIGEVWLNDIVVRRDQDGCPIVIFPAIIKNDRSFAYYDMSGELREDVVAACVEQYELFANNNSTALNHEPVKDNRRLTFK